MSVGASGTVHCLHCFVRLDAQQGGGPQPAASMRVRELAGRAHVLCGGSSAALLAQNSARWAALWRAKLLVEPRVAGDADVTNLNCALEECIFRVLCCVADEVVMGLATIPAWFEASEFSTATLVALRPRAAQPVLSSWEFGPETSMRELARFAIDVWAAFRGTLDREWLRGVYGKVQAVVDEITVRVEVAGAPNGIGPAAGRDGVVGPNNVMTTVLVKHALEAAQQASYELRVRPRAEWGAVSARVAMPVDGATLTGPELAENAIVMHPYYFRSTTGRESAVRVDNLRTTDLAILNADPVLRLTGIAVRASTPNANLTDLASRLLVEVGPAIGWRFTGSAAEDRTVTALLCAMMYGFGNTRISGYVSVDGIHMQSASVSRPRHTPLPAGWAVVRFREAFAGAQEHLTANLSAN
jgi:hypothetical protein